MTTDRPDYDLQKAADTLRDLCGSNRPDHIRLEAARTILDFGRPEAILPSQTSLDTGDDE